MRARPAGTTRDAPNLNHGGFSAAMRCRGWTTGCRIGRIGHIGPDVAIDATIIGTRPLPPPDRLVPEIGKHTTARERHIRRA